MTGRLKLHPTRTGCREPLPDNGTILCDIITSVLPVLSHGVDHDWRVDWSSGTIS